MSEAVRGLAEGCAAVLEAIGIAVIVVVGLYALGFAVVRLAKRVEGKTVFRQTRYRLAGGILLGLEYLVAADIIRTVAIELTFTSVGVLAIIVLIRTFLSFTLEVEMTGRWPWQGEGER